jgi:hypothetical protein
LQNRDNFISEALRSAVAYSQSDLEGEPTSG